MTIEELKYMRESEDHVEFKTASRNFLFNGGSHNDPADRRKCVLGYVVALANEGGGHLVLGMDDGHPHKVVGSDFARDKLGDMENSIYAHLRIRVHIGEQYEDGKRVVIFRIPGRAIGTTLKFEGVPLMRTGDGLRPMSDDMLRSILNEQEPDFSAKICQGLTPNDLDPEAIALMKSAYARKQKNPDFAHLGTAQALSDLELSNGNGLTYAALILLGRAEAIRQHLPQSRIIREFRVEEPQIHHDSREVFEGPLYRTIDQVWNAINDPRLNRKTPIQFGTYFFDLFGLNEKVIREALLNAVAHRDYTMQSEVVVKQYPERIVIHNPGGFPKGVTLENLVTVSSTPRSRLMAEVMEKTGLVERSGQGVDKIFSITLSEGKPEPDYTASDTFQVTLSLSTRIVDRAFHIFINSYQQSDKEPKLGVEQIITLCKVREGVHHNLKPAVVEQLLQLGMIKRMHAAAKRHVLHPDYYQLLEDGEWIGKRYAVHEVERIVQALQEREMRMGELVEALDHGLNRNQVLGVLKRLMQDGVVTSTGRQKGTRYSLSPPFAHLRGGVLFGEVVTKLRELHD